MLTALLAAGLSAAAPAKPAPPGPPVVIQTASVGRLLAAGRFVAKTVAGDDAAKSLDDAIKKKFGDKGLAGIDTKKPIVVYFLTTADFSTLGKLKGDGAAGENDLMNMTFVLALPYSTVPEFKALLGRTFPFDGLEETVGGLYKVTTPREETGPIRIRFHDGYAHIGFGLTDDMMAEKSLTPIGAIVEPNDGALLTYIARGDGPMNIDDPVRAVEGYVEQVLAKGGEQPEGMKALMAQYVGLFRKWLEASRDTAVARVRLTLNEATAEAGLEYAASPKKGSDLAATVAARRPATNKFAGLIGPDAVAGAVLQQTYFVKELREITIQSLGVWEKNTKDVPEALRPLLKEFVKGYTATVQTAEVDFAAAVTGPNKAGLYTAVAATAYEGGADLEKALRAAANDLPAPFRNRLTLDVARAGPAAVHKFVLPEAVPEPIQKVLGTTDVYFAFCPLGLYAAAGGDALPALTAALGKKPGPANVLELTVNPKRVQALIGTADAAAGRAFRAALGADDKTVSAFSLTVTGGERLTLKATVNLKLVPRAAAILSALP